MGYAAPMTTLLLLLFGCPAAPPVETGESSGADTADTSDTADTGGTPTLCDQLGFVTRPWDAAGVTVDFDELAPDATLRQMDGSSWTLSTAWTGCESVMFVVVRAGDAYPDFSEKPDVREWMEGAPPNVHWVFFSDERTAPARETALQELQVDIEAIADADEASLALWQSHTHYVSDSWSRTDTWVDELVDTYGGGGIPLNFAVDRFQRIREVGYLADPVTGWETAPPLFLNYEVRAFNYQADLQDRLDAETVTVIRPFENTGERSATVDFGSAATVAGYDTLELDMQFICNGHPDASGCGEWDYLAYAYLCPVDDAATTEVDESGSCIEIARYITAYARPGRWVVDATPFLALIQDGGERVIRVDSANAPFITLDLRLSNRGKGMRPVAIEYLWSGGGFGATYNDGRATVEFTPSASVKRVDVVALVTGHGYGKDKANCAEFCNHQHEFTVNGAASFTEEFTMAGSAYGCAEQVEQGTVPNQYGTWVLGRGGWCPGRHVDPWTADITASVSLGAANTLDYRGLYRGETYVPEPYDSGQGFGATIVANTWLVYYE